MRELTRVATRDTESQWMEAAAGRTAREVEELVSGRELGDRPDDPREPDAQMHRLTLRLSAPTWALWLEAKQKLVQELGEHVDEEALLATMARAVLGGSGDEGRSHYQASVTVCPECSTVSQRAGSDEVVLDAAAADAALCDAQHVHEHERASQTIPPRIRRKVLARHRSRCAVPGCRQSAFVDLHHADLRSEGGSHDEERLVPLCGAHHHHVHEGRLLVKGRYSTGFIFEHADGTEYGGAPTWVRCKAFIDAHSKLRSRGLSFSRVQAVLDRARDQSIKLEDVLHDAA